MNKLKIVMYHYIRDLAHSRYPRIKGLDIEVFRKQIKYFKENFSIVRMEDVIFAAGGGQKLPENSVLLTFDDGYIDDYIFAMPVLEEEGIQGSFFIPGKTFVTRQLLDVNKIHYILASADIGKLLKDVFARMDYYRGTEFSYPDNSELFAEYAKESRFDNRETVFVKRVLQTVLPEKVRNYISSDLFELYVGVSEEKMAHELYMTEDQIRMMKRHGMFIGIHGYDHYWLGNLSERKMEEDILKALEVMDGFIDRKQWVMNYPYGNYNQDVIKFIKNKGCCLGLTTKVAEVDFTGHRLYEIPRFDCNDFPPVSDNYKEVI